MIYETPEQKQEYIQLIISILNASNEQKSILEQTLELDYLTDISKTLRFEYEN